MVYNIGEYIKTRRRTLGLSQKELANGVCTASTLSRIEQNKENPQDYILKSLLQRLGLSGSEMLFATTGVELIYNQSRFDIRQAYISGDYRKSEKILSENKKLISKLSPTDKQTFETIDTLLRISRSEFSDEEALNRLEAVIRLTCPKYTKDTPPAFFTYEEILLLNNIALLYAKLGDMETAIKLLYHIKNFYDRQVCDIEEALRTEPMILYNLSKCLGLSKKYSECISICEEGIKLATETGRCPCLPQTYYNLAWSSYYRNRPGDRVASQEYLKQAYHGAKFMMREVSAEKYAQRLKEWFNIDVILL
jgi:transcriptional regulator with XRE-family HTH domain